MKTRLSLFIKAPELDQVKTRLANVVGAVKALEIYKTLIDITLDNTSNINGIEKVLSVLGKLDNAAICAWAKKYDLPVQAQRGVDLGERMYNELEYSIREGYRALLIGGDCPRLNEAYIREANSALNSADIVFGPVEDGGYCLVGMNEPCREIFNNISWGSKDVLQESVAAAKAAGRSVARLDTLWDVDYLEDWNRVLATMDSGSYTRFTKLAIN